MLYAFAMPVVSPAKHTQALLSLFRESYGENYVGNERFTDGYLCMAQSAVVIDEPHPYTSALLLRSKRMTAVATRTNTREFGPRAMNLIRLLQLTASYETESYITIGLDSIQKVGSVAASAGMSPSQDRGLAEERLSAFGNVDRYAIEESEDGLCIALKTSSKGSAYWQQIWDWHQ